MATVRLAADKATLDVSWTNYFTECKSKGRAYFKGKIQTGGEAGGKAGAQGGSCPPPAGAAHGRKAGRSMPPRGYVRTYRRTRRKRSASRRPIRLEAEA